MDGYCRPTPVDNYFLFTMPSRLGLVCIRHSPQVRFRTITRTRLLQNGKDEQRALLAALYRDNLGRLDTAPTYCTEENVALYRIPSSLFPFYDAEIGRQAMTELAAQVAEVGARANALKVRLVMHPDQFVFLNSESPKVVDNSIAKAKFKEEAIRKLQLASPAYA